ncbi:MAG: hypothetical protein E7560_05960 [Ruminococcaceae bacterium]|nr:hypothetical protein [Oscillospiraceae bacterium]
MEKKNNSDFMFYIEEDSNTNEFEDIVSDSGKTDRDIYSNSVDLSSFSGKHRYAKKPRGFFGKCAYWWRKRKTWQKASMITAVSFLLVFAILFGIIRVVFDYNYNDITDTPEDLGFENVLDKNIVNVALFGIDTRSTISFKGNSDSIMILSLNTETKKVKIISVLRDSLVPITYNGKTVYSKINSAYSRGGPELAIKTLNTIFNLDISEYATVNFYGMIDIIDAVGGIDAELTQKEVAKYDGTQHQINGCIKEICDNLGKDPKDYYIYTPGKQHLNGIQAVAYSRIRYVANIWGTTNDYGRTDRQRYVMEQLFNKAITLEKTQYVKLAKSLIPCSETSLSYTEIMGLAFDILLHSPTFEQARVPQQEYQMTSPKTSAGSVVYYDLEFAEKLIHKFIYEDIAPQDYIDENGVEKNDWYRKKFGDSSTVSSTTQGSSDDDDETDEPVTSDDEETEDPEDSSSNESSTDETTSSGNESGNESDSDNDNETSSEEGGTEEGDDEPSKPSDSTSSEEGGEDSTQPPEKEPENSGENTRKRKK